MSTKRTHVLEHNAAARSYVQTGSASGNTNRVAAYRRAVMDLVGTLPSWLAQRPTGRPRKAGEGHGEASPE